MSEGEEEYVEHLWSMCPDCGVWVTEQTTPEFYIDHGERCGGDLKRPMEPELDV